MAEAGVGVKASMGESQVAASAPPRFVDKAVLPPLETEFTRESLLGQATKMLSLMELLQPDQTVEIVGELDGGKTKIKISGEGSGKAQEVEYDYLHNRYRKLEVEALKARSAEREELEVVVAKYLGKTISEMGIKYVDTGENYLSKSAQIDTWKKKDNKPVVERMQASAIIESLQKDKISYFQAIKNLKQVYGSTKVANEKYISQMALGKVFDKTFKEAEERSLAIAKQAEALDAVPDQEKGFWHKVKRATAAIKQTLDKPLAPVGATVKALTGLALYDYNPVRMALEKPMEKIWAEIPISDPTFGGKFPKMEKIQVMKDVTMREAAAKLEERLMVDPITGEGVRTGAITRDQIREASVEGAKWALKMHVLPDLISKLPGINALSLKPGDVYSMIRSSKMIGSGKRSIEAFSKKFKAAKTNKEKGMLTASMVSAGVGFYAAEKLAPVIGGVINPILMADIALMRLVGEVDKYAGKERVNKTNLAENLKTVEEAITISFAADSASAVGESMVNLAETGSTNPLAEIKDEASLLQIVVENPEYLEDNGGGVFGDIRRAEHAIIEYVHGIEPEDNPWQAFSFEEGVVYQVGPDEDGKGLTVIKQDSEGGVAELRDHEWVAVESPVESLADEPPQNTVEEVSRVTDSAVHDYVYFDSDSSTMAFRMDLVPGETWESKVERLFEGYGGDGGIDDPARHIYPDGKEIQSMPENTPELIALSGQDGVYETQIHEMLIKRLLVDAANNGLIYDKDIVKARMVEFLKSDTTADADTVEGEIDYGALYQNLFVGSQVTQDIASLDTAVYKPYFLSGNEGTDKGIEVQIEIPPGGTVFDQLAKQGYGSGNGKFYDAQSNELPDARVYAINDDGTESMVEDFAELNIVQPGDKFVVRTGVGQERSLVEGEMPEIVPLNESSFSSFELAPTEAEKIMIDADWESEVVRNEKGEIFVGSVKEGQVFSQMMIDRFSGVMNNPWDLLPVIQNMEANGVQIYAESSGEDGSMVRRVLNSYDDLGTIFVNERIVIVDAQRVLSEIPDQRTEIDLDETIPPPPQPLTPGFGPDGLLDIANPPTESMRDAAGYIYVGEIKDGMYLSTIVASNLPRTEGADTWQRVYELYEEGKIEIFKVGQDGELLKMDDLNVVNIGDKIIIKDVEGLIEGITNVEELVATQDEAPIEQIVNPESESIDVESIKAKIESEIAELGEEVKIGLTVIDLDNAENTIEIGNEEQFGAKEAQKLAIAMATLKAVDSGEISLVNESQFVVLPGDYKPSIEHLLNLMLVQNDPVARDGLLKELEEIDMDAMLGADTGLKEVLSDTETTTSEVAKLYTTLLRTTYLSDESRELLQQMIKSGQEVRGGLLVDDWAYVPGLEITEMSLSNLWSGSAGNSPDYSSFANFTSSEGNDYVVVLTADADQVDQARSALKTIAREVIQELDSGAEIVSDEELGLDVAKHVSVSNQAKLDYVNHVIAPYRTETGTYLFDPIIEAEVSDIKDLDLTSFDKQVTTFADGSGLIHISNEETGRLISVFVDNDQKVSMVLDNFALSASQINYEIYPAVGEKREFAQNELSLASEQVNLEISLELASNFDFRSTQDRINFVDVVRASGKEYDFYVFVDNSNGEEVTIMYGGDSETYDQATRSGRVSIAMVTMDTDTHLDSKQTQATLETLLTKIGSASEITDISWKEWDTSYPLSADDWDKSQEHWFDPLDIKGFLRESEMTEISPAGNSLFNDVIMDSFGITLPESSTSVMVDGVNFSKIVYIPEGMQIDKAVIARSNDLDYAKLVIRTTNDANVYLIGERVDEEVVDIATLKASYTHPSDQLLYQYKDGTLSSDHVVSDENPLVAVFPLEKSLASYLDVDRLVKLDDKLRVNIQYQAKPYFVLSEDGVKSEVYVNPYTLECLVKSGEDFIPLVVDSFTYSEIAQIYGKELGSETTVSQVWEQRIVDAITQDARRHNLSLINEGGSIVVYDKDGDRMPKVLQILHDDSGVVMMGEGGEILLQDNFGQKVKYSNGHFLKAEGDAVVNMAEYLQDFEYVVGDEGKPLQYRGAPILSRGELVYIVDQNGVTLIGSLSEFNLQGYIEDDAIGELLSDWDIEKHQNLSSEPRNFRNLTTEAEKMIHGISVTNERLLTIENGLLDLKSGERFVIEVRNDDIYLDSISGKVVFKNESGDAFYVWSGSEWESVASDHLVSAQDYLKDQGMTVVEDEYGRGEVVDRRTQSTVYVRDNWAYTLDGSGPMRIGQLDEVLKAGFIGYLDDDGKYQTYTPDNISDIYGNPTYTMAERASLLFNPVINQMIGMSASISNLWSDYSLRDVLPTIKKDDYLGYEELPPQYVAALIAQENKTIYRGGEGEAANLDLGVLVKVLLSGGERGGSTLVQGLVKNVLMSPEDRLERSLTRKWNELLIADQVLEEMSVEEVVAMYANTVSYGSINGREITGIGEAAEFLFGKKVHELDLIETGLLVALPNYPTRNNLYSASNAVSWADSASGVYRHMYENGFISRDEMEQAFLDVHEKVLPNGGEDEVELLIKTGAINESDREWAMQVMEQYSLLKFDERKLVESTTTTQSMQLGTYGLAGASSIPLVPAAYGIDPIVEEVVVTRKYADFFAYLKILDEERISTEGLEEAYKEYYWTGKTFVSESERTPPTKYLEIDQDINPSRLGIEYTTSEYDPERKNYYPRVEIDDNGDAVIDAWSHRYEAISKDGDGNTIAYNVVSVGVDGSATIVQDNDGKLWRVGDDGLISVPGRVYQVEGGGAVQAMIANDRPGILFDISGVEISGLQYVRDDLGNYYKVVEGSRVEYVGQVMQSSDGRNILFKLDEIPNFHVAKEEKNILSMAVLNATNYRGNDIRLSPGYLPTSSDPNMGYVEPRGQGEFGLINPLGAENYLHSQGVISQAIEIRASGDGKQVFEQYLSDVVSQDKAVLVWLNNDLATDVMRLENRDGVSFESISRYEKPVSVLQIFDFEGVKYVVYQDPTQTSPQVVSFNRFASLASPSSVDRYKTLVMGEYQLGPEYGSYIYDHNAQVNQVGILVGDGYVYNTENPSEVEAMMSINPIMQQFANEEAKKVLDQSGGSGVVALAMDQSGRVVFDVSLDADGNPDPEMITRTYQPGSVYKLVASMWAMESGVDPSKYYEAGDYYQWEEGDKTYNWTIDPLTGLLKYGEGAAPTMSLSDAIKHSNNPYFLRLIANAENFNDFAAYARSVGFGDGKGHVNVVSQNSIVPDPSNPENILRYAAYNAIGQADVAVTAADMISFVSAISNGGKLIDPILAREVPDIEHGNLPNKPTDYAVIVEAMHRVTSEPGGTAYQVFHDVAGYEVYGKTGTAETGEDPNAWFVGWAVNKTTGEKLSFVFLIPNGGEGSRVAAPLARLILDQYFSDLNAHKAMLPDQDTLAVESTESLTVVEPVSNILSVLEVEQGTIHFRLEDQPNKEMIALATEATRIANQYVPSSNDMSTSEEGKEFVSHLKRELANVGYGSLVDSPEMDVAFNLLLNDYKTYGGLDPSEAESVQCVAWQVFLGQTQSIMMGAPVTMSRRGDAYEVVNDVVGENLRTGAAYNRGIVVRFADDKPDISLMDPGDTFYIKYPGETALGHTGVILAESLNTKGEPMVLISDANRYVDENGRVISDGKIRLRWMTQAEFDIQYVTSGDRYLGIAPSQLVVIRPKDGERVQSVFDPSYRSEIAPQEEWLEKSDPEWEFAPNGEGELILPFENSVALQREHVGEMQPVDSIYIHWSGAASSDPSTWTAKMVKNGLEGEETSSTFAVGVDGIIQMAKFDGENVQETFATPWQHGAINIEIAGEDFDNNPPTKEHYQKVVELVTQLLISSNKPITIMQPHYKEIYMWSTDMPNRFGGQGNWMLLDNRDLKTARYWDMTSEDWLPLHETSYSYDPASLQSKIDPGEKFFAQLTEDVQKRLVALGHADLASYEVAVSELAEQTINPIDLELRIVDRENPITREEIEIEIVPYLVSVDAVDPILDEAATGNDIKLHRSMMPDLKDMILASKQGNVSLFMTSGYRSFDDQVKALLEKNGDTTLATLPGQSQHHAGLAIDFTSSEIDFSVGMEAGFENTEAGKWLAENGWKYGFVQSYTKNHDGVQNEPWHYYYVGKTYARIWHDSQQTDHPRDIFEILKQVNSPEG